jgi:hypothetical protein
MIRASRTTKTHDRQCGGSIFHERLVPPLQLGQYQLLNIENGPFKVS